MTETKSANGSVARFWLKIVVGFLAAALLAYLGWLGSFALEGGRQTREMSVAEHQQIRLEAERHDAELKAEIARELDKILDEQKSQRTLLMEIKVAIGRLESYRNQRP